LLANVINIIHLINARNMEFIELYATKFVERNKAYISYPIHVHLA